MTKIALILISGNGGDLVLTREFQSYKEERKLTIQKLKASSVVIDDLIFMAMNQTEANLFFHLMDEL